MKPEELEKLKHLNKMKDKTKTIILIVSITISIILLLYSFAVPYFEERGFQKARQYYANNKKLPILWSENNQTTIIDVTYADFNYLIKIAEARLNS